MVPGDDMPQERDLAMGRLGRATTELRAMENERSAEQGERSGERARLGRLGGEVAALRTEVASLKASAREVQQAQEGDLRELGRQLGAALARRSSESSEAVAQEHTRSAALHASNEALHASNEALQAELRAKDEAIARLNARLLEEQARGEQHVASSKS